MYYDIRCYSVTGKFRPFGRHLSYWAAVLHNHNIVAGFCKYLPRNPVKSQPIRTASELSEGRSQCMKQLWCSEIVTEIIMVLNGYTNSLDLNYNYFRGFQY